MKVGIDLFVKTNFRFITKFSIEGIILVDEEMLSSKWLVHLVYGCIGSMH